MGCIDTILSGTQGACRACSTIYVTKAEWLQDDSHHRYNREYSCPGCGSGAVFAEEPLKKYSEREESVKEHLKLIYRYESSDAADKINLRFEEKLEEIK